MASSNPLQLVYAEKVKGGVHIEFADGASALYSGAFLRKNIQSAEAVDPPPSDDSLEEFDGQ